MITAGPPFLPVKDPFRFGMETPISVRGSNLDSKFEKSIDLFFSRIRDDKPLLPML